MSRKALKITAGVTATAFTIILAAGCAAQNDEEFIAEREAQQAQEQQLEQQEAADAEARAKTEAEALQADKAKADTEAKAKESAAAQQSAEAKAQADAAKAEQERQAEVDANIAAREAAIQAEADAAEAAALAAATSLCDDGQEVEQIMQPLLLNQRLTFDNTQIIMDGADIWVAASLIRPDGSIDSRSDVWVYLEETGMVHAVSMGARGNSLAPDAPFGYGMANANAKTVDQCVVDATTGN